MDCHTPSEHWSIIRYAILVCAKKATLSELRTALRVAGYWPPSTALPEIESKCSTDIEAEN